MRLLSVALCLCCLSLAQTALAADAPMFRGNAAHTGVYSTTAVHTLHGIKWKFHTGGYVVSSPAVVADSVYVGSDDGYLYALNRANGERRWQFKTGSRVASSPAVADGVVYFGSYDGNFYAIDARNGKRRWSFKTLGERRFAATHLHGTQPVAERMPDPFDVYLSSPVLWNGMVFFGSGDGHVYALDSTSGSLRWKFSTGDVVHASPAIADGVLYIGSWDSYFYALDAANGRRRWRFKTGDDPDIHNQIGIQASAAVLDGTVIFGCRDSHLYALDTRSGRQRWSIPTHGSWVISSAAVRDGMVYFATSDSGLFYAVHARDGKTAFSLRFHEWPTFSSPAIAGDYLYLGSHAGGLNAIDLVRQRLAWSFKSDGAKRHGAQYTKADGTPKYEAAFASDFYDDLIVGVTRMMSVGAFLSSPVIADGVIYVGSTDGNLYALD